MRLEEMERRLAEFEGQNVQNEMEKGWAEEDEELVEEPVPTFNVQEAKHPSAGRR
uniref:Uncharacterized protein n=1 Tax=Setaria digitata TaxID=48799 RepID=A0A915Q2M6_9BILA